MITGGAVTLIWEIGLNKPLDWNSILVAMPLATFALIIISLLTRPASSNAQTSRG